jgi:hypothetical protein
VLRRRDIAAAPARRADEAWSAVVGLIADTLDRSPDISGVEVKATLSVLSSVGPRLVAGRHLEQNPIVLVAEPVRLSIYTASGAAAVTLEENLAPVPGGASAAEWLVYVPTPDPLATEVETAIAGRAHLSTEQPARTVVKAAASGDLIDLDALASYLHEERP